VALGGLTVSTHQNTIFKKASALVDRIEAKGGLPKATDADIMEMKKMHAEIEQAHPDLFSLRQKKLEEFGKGNGDVDLSDLEAARK
jgi:hypothetical protein